MTWTPDERRAYGRGYNTGSAKTWPKHRPPMPPEPRIRALMIAMQELRDCADTLCSSLSEDDDFVVQLGPKIDAFDAEMTRVGEWLTAAPSPAEGESNG